MEKNSHEAPLSMLALQRRRKILTVLTYILAEGAGAATGAIHPAGSGEGGHTGRRFRVLIPGEVGTSLMGVRRVCRPVHV